MQDQFIMPVLLATIAVVMLFGWKQNKKIAPTAIWCAVILIVVLAAMKPDEAGVQAGRFVASFCDNAGVCG